MNIEINKIESEKLEDNYILLINNVQDEKTHVFEISNKLFVSTDNFDLNSFVVKWAIPDFKRLSIENYTYKLETDKYYHHKQVRIKIPDESDEICARVEVQFETELWDKPYSLTQLANEIERCCYEDVSFYQEDEETILNGFGIQTIFSDNVESIQKYYEKVVDAYEDIFLRAEKNLLEEINKSSIVSYFNFPQEIESACKQYLIYFTEFLKDIGINAESNISTQLGRTIFTVKPTDKNQALELIKETLNFYLNLPSNPETKQISLINQDIGAQQLISNIQFLQSQIVLGNAILQAKNAAIDSLELSNYQLKQIVDSKDKELEKYNDSEDVVKGIVSVSKYENNGLSINLGEIVRRIKRKIK